MVKRELYLIAGGLYLRYGSYMAAASAALLTLNNLEYEDLEKNLEKNLDKNLEKNLDENLETIGIRTWERTWERT